MAETRGGKRAGAGRPKGAKNKATLERKATVAELADAYTGEAIDTLAEIMRDTKAPAAARARAADSLLDRAHGKPAQAVVEPDDPEAPALSIIIKAKAPVADVRVTRPDS